VTSIFPPDAGLKTGIPELDGQTPRLETMLNRAFNLLISGDEGDSDAKLFESLEEFANGQFPAEEALWKAKCVDDARVTAQAESHARFRAEIRKLRQGILERGVDETRFLLMDFLLRWTATHVLIEDAGLGVTIMGSGTFVSEYLDQLRYLGNYLQENALEWYRESRARQLIEKNLESALKQANSATLARTAFLSTMSHEIRTPLNAILGLSHLAQKSGLAPQLSDYMRKIEASGQHLLGIMTEVLAYARLESGQLAIHEVDFNIDDILNSVRDTIGEKARQKGLRFSMRKEGTVPKRVRGDAEQIRHILNNYGKNALKYTSAGSITVTVAARRRKGNYLLLHFTVADTGVGIAEKDKGALFSEFRQADMTHSRKYGGMGLGLVVSKRLAELMHGDTGVESVPGEGSTFWFTARVSLPNADEADESPPDTNEAIAARFSGLGEVRILLAEDDEINQDVAVSLLSDAGLRVDVASNGQEALEKSRRAAYDLILMDVQMPVMDGLTAALEIRKNPAYASVPIIAMTANNDRDPPEEYALARISSRLIKPIDPSDLKRVIVEALGRPSTAPIAEAAPGPETKAICDNLLALFRDADAAALDFLGEHRAALTAAFPDAVQEIVQSAEAYDLDKAGKALLAAMAKAGIPT